LSSFQPSLAVFKNNVYLTWADRQSTDTDDILFRKSTNNGIKFDAVVNLSNNPGNSDSPVIAVFQEDVYIVWNDQTGDELGRDVFFLRSINGGNTFGATTPIIQNGGSTDIAVTENIA
jgi:hypothetical protein